MMGTPTAEGLPVGIVLAGGRSTRMGRDKAILELGGETLLTRACRVLHDAGVTRCVVSGDRPVHQGVPDKIAGRGPLGGLYSVLPALDEPWAWVVPVDMPWIDAALLMHLRDQRPVSAAAFIDDPLPMLLKLDANCRMLVAAMARSPDGPRSLRHLLRALGGQEVAIPDQQAWRLFNCNTPEQWKEAET